MKKEKLNWQVYLIISLWIILSYGLPFVKSVVGTPLLYIRYTIVTLPAWLILLAIGWESIDGQRLKIILVTTIFISSILNLTWRLNYYNRIEKAQYRQTSELVKRENSDALPVYSAFSWHWNFYFRNEQNKVKQIQYENLPDRFWLVQSHTDEEMEKEINTLEQQFNTVDSFRFHQANAFFLKRR